MNNDALEDFIYWATNAVVSKPNDEESDYGISISLTADNLRDLKDGYGA